MQENIQYLEEDFIIWNATLGIRDFVTIVKIEDELGIVNGWLDDPYEMVGPFSLEELRSCGEISFAQCVVMTKQRWHENKDRFQKEAYIKQAKAQKEFYEDIKKHNQKRQKFQYEQQQQSEKEHRELLSLPLEGELEIAEIKAAFRKAVKTAHPDVGGSHELFVKITKARDILLGE
jgi:dTDP-4-amino-4,6-dideoxygalactose transaminase